MSNDLRWRGNGCWCWRWSWCWHCHSVSDRGAFGFGFWFAVRGRLWSRRFQCPWRRFQSQCLVGESKLLQKFTVRCWLAFPVVTEVLHFLPTLRNSWAIVVIAGFIVNELSPVEIVQTTACDDIRNELFLLGQRETPGAVLRTSGYYCRSLYNGRFLHKRILRTTVLRVKVRVWRQRSKRREGTRWCLLLHLLQTMGGGASELTEEGGAGKTEEFAVGCGTVSTRTDIGIWSCWFRQMTLYQLIS